MTDELLNKYRLEAEGIFGCPAALELKCTQGGYVYTLLIYPGNAFQPNHMKGASPAVCIHKLKEALNMGEN